MCALEPSRPPGVIPTSRVRRTAGGHVACPVGLSLAGTGAPSCAGRQERAPWAARGPARGRACSGPGPFARGSFLGHLLRAVPLPCPRGLPSSSSEAEGQGTASCIAGGPGALALVLPLVPSVTLAAGSPSRDLGIPVQPADLHGPSGLRMCLTCAAARLAGHVLSASSGRVCGPAPPEAWSDHPWLTRAGQWGASPRPPGRLGGLTHKGQVGAKWPLNAPGLCPGSRKSGAAPSKPRDAELRAEAPGQALPLNGVFERSTEPSHGCGRVLGQRGHPSSCPRGERRVNAELAWKDPLGARGALCRGETGHR